MSEALLELAADVLGLLVCDVVFVGGATVHLWLTEPAAPPVRATDDVDVVCDVTSYAQYQALAERLRERGLVEALGEPVICRWRHPDRGLVLDVMPVAEDVLGFSNPWYPLGIDTAIERTLPSGTTIRAMAPAALVACKLAAWRGRGHGDIIASLDVNDILVLIDGRLSLASELASLPAEARAYTRQELADLLADPYLDYAIEGAIAGYGSVATSRARIVRQRLETIVSDLARD